MEARCLYCKAPLEDDPHVAGMVRTTHTHSRLCLSNPRRSYHEPTFAQPCPDCGGTGSVTASWGERLHCQRCSCAGQVTYDSNGRTTPFKVASR